MLVWAPAPGTRSERRAVAWDLLRELLADRGHPDARLRNPCPRCGGPHGPMQVVGAPWRAAVSYAAGWAVVGVRAEDGRTFAIDAEPLHDAVRDNAGSAGWGGDILHWVRAEAVLKATGEGLRLDPAAVTVTAGTDGWSARIAGRDGAFRGEEVEGPPGVLVSAAVSEAPEAPAGRASR